MSKHFIWLGILITCLSLSVYTIHVVKKKTECHVKGIIQSGTPWTWEGGTSCVMLVEPPNKQETSASKPHKWMI